MKPQSRAVTPALFEFLEQRALLSGAPPYPFVTAGLHFDPTTDRPASMFWAEGTVLADDTFTGSYESFDATSRSGPGPLPWAGFTRPDVERMNLNPAAGFTGYASQSSFQFIAQQEFPLGTFVGRDSSGSVLDSGVFVEPYFTSPFGLGGYLRQDYLIATLNVMTAQRGAEVATLVATPASINSSDWKFEYFFAGGDYQSFDVHVVSITPTLTVFDNGIRVYSTTQRKTNFFVVDPQADDGIVGFGVGLARWVAANDSVTLDKLPGIYRGSVFTDGTESATFFGSSASTSGFTGSGVADVVIEITADAFKIYNANQYAHGLRNPVNAGLWQYEHNDRSVHENDLGQLRMTDSAGRYAIVRVAGNSFSTSILIPRSVTGVGASTTEQISGIVRVGTPGTLPDDLSLQEAVFTTDADGHVIALQHGISSDAALVGWYSLDLTQTFGTQTVTGSLYSWHTYDFTRASVLARATNGDLLYWNRLDGQWTFKNLTQSIDGAQPLAGDISGVQFSTSRGHPTQVAIVSTNSEGLFIAYTETTPGGEWQFIDVESRGLLGEGVHPNLVGALAGFGTIWGGYNFAGRDADGHIWSLWHSEQLGTQWAINNLSTAAGGVPAITSNLTALTTAWNAFQISGFDAQGHVIVTWWTWNIGWRYDGLTDFLGGATFSGTQLSSNYNAELNVMNITGFDAEGDAVVYWWNPKAGWAVAFPATALGTGDRPANSLLFDGFRVRYTNIPGLIATFQSVTWNALDGHTKRLAWHDTAPDGWTFEDITALAKPL